VTIGFVGAATEPNAGCFGLCLLAPPSAIVCEAALERRHRVRNLVAEARVAGPGDDSTPSELDARSVGADQRVRHDPGLD
jgi:hypothetical protein